MLSPGAKVWMQASAPPPPPQEFGVAEQTFPSACTVPSPSALGSAVFPGGWSTRCLTMTCTSGWHLPAYKTLSPMEDFPWKSLVGQAAASNKPAASHKPHRPHQARSDGSLPHPVLYILTPWRAVGRKSAFSSCLFVVVFFFFFGHTTWPTGS